MPSPDTELIGFPERQGEMQIDIVLRGAMAGIVSEPHRTRDIIVFAQEFGIGQTIGHTAFKFTKPVPAITPFGRPIRIMAFKHDATCSGSREAKSGQDHRSKRQQVSCADLHEPFHPRRLLDSRARGSGRGRKGCIA